LTNPEKLRSYREASRTHAEVFSLEEIVSEYESCLEGFL